MLYTSNQHTYEYVLFPYTPTILSCHTEKIFKCLQFQELPIPCRIPSAKYLGRKDVNLSIYFTFEFRLECAEFLALKLHHGCVRWLNLLVDSTHSVSDSRGFWK